jgi:ATP-binding cassette subfamily G (WHITE) protein 2 (SNQ2)
MKPWFAWIRWIDPVYCPPCRYSRHYFASHTSLFHFFPDAFEALMGNEFAGQTFECVPNQLVPYGPGYTPGQNQGELLLSCAFDP